MIPKEKINDDLTFLHKQKEKLIEIIDNFKHGYGLPGHLEIDLLNVGMTDFYGQLCKENEKTCVPMLKVELEKIQASIKKLSKLL